MRKYVLDTACFIDAANDPQAAEAFEAFCLQAAPGLFLSSVVAAELRSGMRSAVERKRLERLVLEPYLRRGRLITPSTSAWEALGSILATLREREGLEVERTPRSFVFDVLIASSCREAGAVLISANVRDMERIARVAAFDWARPYPSLSPAR